MNSITVLTEDFDLRDKIKEIEPELERIHQFFKENNIPYVLGACTMNNVAQDHHTMTLCAHSDGPERVPPALTMSLIALHEDVGAAMMFGASVMAGAVKVAADAGNDAAEEEADLVGEKMVH